MVVTTLDFEAQGKGSGATVTLPSTNVWRFRDGVVSTFAAYRSLGEALGAAGLRE